MMSVATSNTNNIALIRSSFDSPPEVWAGELMNLRQITHINDEAKPLWGKAESVEWDNEGFHVQGWLLLPGALRSGEEVSAHRRGPWRPFFSRGAALARRRLWPRSVLRARLLRAACRIPRGSYGQGEKFTQANRKDFGYGDLRDILAGVDAVEKKYPVDDSARGPHRLELRRLHDHVRGHPDASLQSRGRRRGHLDWQSYYGENSIDQWMIPFFGASVYDDPAVYAKSSAINFIKNVKTPTLVVVGDRDGECPAPQSFEFWHALRDLGDTTELVVYPNEGHGFVEPRASARRAGAGAGMVRAVHALRPPGRLPEKRPALLANRRLHRPNPRAGRPGAYPGTLVMCALSPVLCYSGSHTEFSRAWTV